jgi:hypothetical protein
VEKERRKSREKGKNDKEEIKGEEGEGEEQQK